MECKGALAHFRCRGLIRSGKASAEQVQFGASVHLPFDELELGDLAFGLTVGPGFDQRCSDCGSIDGDAFAEGREDTGHEITVNRRRSLTPDRRPIVTPRRRFRLVPVANGRGLFAHRRKSGW
jgi:hypothetical protein